MPDAFAFKYLETFPLELFLRGKCAIWWTVMLLPQLFQVRHLVDTRAIARPKRPTSVNSSFNLFLNHSCKSSILKIKCSFNSHFIYKVIFQQRGRRMATDFHPLLTSITTHCQSSMLCRMLLLRWGAKQNHTMVLTVGDLGSFQRQPQQDSRGPLWDPAGPLVLVSARLQKIQTKQKRKERKINITPKRRR